MNEYYDVFCMYLQKQGLKLTRVRKEILETVFTTHSHFDADELYDLVRDKNVSRATVYRTLPLMVESGLVKKSMFGLSKEKYEHIYGHPNHFHIICNKCGRVVEQTDMSIEKAIKKITENNGFSYDDYNLRISGICSLCKDSDNNEQE